ncbi:HAMP domain-containing histidine kinase [Solibacillus sp. CAU 1738]|uniref:HAMP domain-containing sensor histidine kinase n=1 Tax=Solibacillus sp. CAU 1738 TaxID=3140363 RepID=UPI00326197F7
MNRKQIIRNLSLKKKWMLTSGVTIFVSYAAICIVLYLALHTWLINNEEKNALRTADDITTFFNTLGVNVTIQQLQHNTGLMKAIVNQEQTVRILNLDGVELIRINDASPAANTNATYDELLSTKISEQKVGGTKAYIIERIVQIGPFQGYMQLIHPLTTFQKMMQYVLTTMLIMGVGALLLSASISYVLANRLIRPLQQLRDSMRTIRDKGLEEREQFTYQADDEIGDVLTMYNAMLEELEISFTKQQQFVADASHELRTPIQAVEGHLSLLARWGKDDPVILSESIDISLIEVRRMKKMIEELLQLARREQVMNAEANLEQVLDQVINELITVYPNAKITHFVEGQLSNVNVSPEALAQIIRNIIENGIRYNNRLPEISVKSIMREKYVYVEISDNGIGIAEQHLPLIFDRFYRVDESRQQNGGGTGLGLSISKMLADKYGVDINVNSHLEKGTSFLLTIPKKNP